MFAVVKVLTCVTLVVKDDHIHLYGSICKVSSVAALVHEQLICFHICKCNSYHGLTSVEFTWACPNKFSFDGSHQNFQYIK